MMFRIFSNMSNKVANLDFKIGAKILYKSPDQSMQASTNPSQFHY
jgi:hypothetical protein